MEPPSAPSPHEPGVDADQEPRATAEPYPASESLTAGEELYSRWLSQPEFSSTASDSWPSKVASTPSRMAKSPPSAVPAVDQPATPAAVEPSQARTCTGNVSEVAAVPKLALRSERSATSHSVAPRHTSVWPPAADSDAFVERGRLNECSDKALPLASVSLVTVGSPSAPDVAYSTVQPPPSVTMSQYTVAVSPVASCSVYRPEADSGLASRCSRQEAWSEGTMRRRTAKYSARPPPSAVAHDDGVDADQAPSDRAAW